MKAPIITVIDREFALQAQIDIYTSFLLNRKWQSVGDWQLVLPASAQGADKLKKGNIILLGADGHRSGYIESTVTDENESGVVLTVSGKTLQGLASQRITLPDNDKFNYGYDNVPKLTSNEINSAPIAAETVLKSYVRRHMTEPDDPKRRFTALETAKDLKRGAKTLWSSRLEALSDVLWDICEYCDIGWEIYADIKRKRLVFDIAEGVDRSYGQSENSRVIFSRSFENILSSSYTSSFEGYRNLAYAGGAGEGADRTVLKITAEDSEPEDWERREIFLDLGSLGVVETDTAMSLSDEALHKMKEYVRIETLTASIAETKSFEYLEKWDLGDKVTVVNKAAGVRLNTRITEVSERYESGSCGVDVTFGAPKAELGRVIRSIRGTPK